MEKPKIFPPCSLSCILDLVLEKRKKKDYLVVRFLFDLIKFCKIALEGHSGIKDLNRKYCTNVRAPQAITHPWNSVLGNLKLIDPFNRKS